MHELQSRLLAFFRSHPTTHVNLRQLGLKMGGEHAQNIKYHLQRLEQNGLIQLRADGSVFLMSAQNAHAHLIAIPIVGAASCGVATAIAEENIEGYLQVSPSMIGRRRDLFAIRAVGDSMNRANIGGHTIDDGDFVLIDHRQRTPKNGDYVLFVANGLANIKRFTRNTRHEPIILISESTREYPPIYIHPSDYSDTMVNGHVLQVIKKPEKKST